MKITTLAFTSLVLLGACDKKEAPPAATAAPTPSAAAPAAAAAAPAAAPAAAAPAATPAAEPPPLAIGTKTKCVVSGDEFTVSAKTQQVVYNGKRYAFCCPDCQPDFAKNPAKYAAK
jgi:YHS domain-containing protein